MEDFMEQMKIMFDMDDVLVSGGFLYLINSYLGTHYKESDFKTYYMQDVVPDKEAFFEYFLQHNLYDYATVTEGAIELLKELNEHHKVYIGTSYIIPEVASKSGVLLDYKYQFLTRTFPFLDPNRFVFLGDKSVLQCDVKVDDKLSNLENADTKILYTAYHNFDLADSTIEEYGAVRANDMQEVKRLILKK